MSKNSENLIIPPSHAIRSLRDSGYKNTAHALAELIDNSIQAKATDVELICVETYVDQKSSSRKRLTKIATLDNGSGMNKATLFMALQFGNGTHLNDRSGIGRFGMGLPNSSISQCRRLDVWTWMNGPDNALHSYLDVDEIESGVLNVVPEPSGSPVPKEWRDNSEILTKTGTLVVWSRFEEHRLSWRGAAATIRNTEEIVGRMYRKFICEGDAKIHFTTISADESIERQAARVNDPMYLMNNSMTPRPFNEEPMFQPWGKGEEKFNVNYDGKDQTIIVRFSWAKTETLATDGKNRGNSDYGKHAGKNAGLSIVRERRELELDKSWTSDYDPRDRWWGVEIEFPAKLDEIFGVTNNKQNANTFSRLARYDWTSEAERGESLSSFCERLKEEGDPKGYLLFVVDYINEQIKALREKVAQQARGTRTARRHDNVAADRATREFIKRRESGHGIPSDSEKLTEKSLPKFVESLKQAGYEDEIAKKIAEGTLSRDRKVEFLEGEIEGHAFFTVKKVAGGVTTVTFNTSHPFHKELLEVIEPPSEGEDNSKPLQRITTASYVLKIVFAAWARYEIEETQDSEKLVEFRYEWGKMVKEFLTDGVGV